MARILVVDNHSTDQSKEFTEGRADWITLDRNYGFAFAVNRAIERVDTEFVAIVNNDVVLDPRWLEELENALANPDLHFACPLLLSASAPDRIDGAWDLLSRSGCPERALHGKERSASEATSPRQTHFVPMTAALFRTSLFRELGLLDESYVSYLEDVDFGLRAAMAGKAGGFVPSAQAIHVGSATLGAWSSRMVYWNARNQLLLVARHFPTTLIRRWWRALLVGQLLYLLLAARHGHLWSAVRGKLSVLRRWNHSRSAIKSAPTDDLVESTPRLREVIENSEREILELQQTGDSSWYWKLYFRLAGKPGRTP